MRITVYICNGEKLPEFSIWFYKSSSVARMRRREREENLKETEKGEEEARKSTLQKRTQEGFAVYVMTLKSIVNK